MGTAMIKGFGTIRKGPIVKVTDPSVVLVGQVPAGQRTEPINRQDLLDTTMSTSVQLLRGHPYALCPLGGLGAFTWTVRYYIELTLLVGLPGLE